LLLYAVIGALLALLAVTDIGISPPFLILHLLALVLFLVGLPAIHATQPETGRAGQVGLTLMGLAAAIALVVVVLALTGGADLGPIVPFLSALSGLIGDALIGFLTVRAGKFPAWTGWLLGLSGILNFGTGLLSGAVDVTVLAELGDLLGAAAIAGYGWTIVQRWRGHSA
jgi:hypothetical protein